MNTATTHQSPVTQRLLDAAFWVAIGFGLTMVGVALVMDHASWSAGTVAAIFFVAAHHLREEKLMQKGGPSA